MLLGDNGDIHVAGDAGDNFPTTAGAVQLTHAGLNDAFVSSLSADGSQLLFSTYLGGNRTELVEGLATDGAGNLVIAGRTESPDFPVTNQAPQRRLAGGADAFISIFSCDGDSLQFSSYLGTPGGEFINALTGNGAGIFTLIGETNSSAFPTTSGVLRPNFRGETELFIAQFDLRSENLAALQPVAAVQGVTPISLAAVLPPCPSDPLDVQWFDETNGISFPVNTNPVMLTPTPTQSLRTRVDVTNTVTMNTASRIVHVLVAQNSLYFDLNGDGCNDSADLNALADQWRTPVVDDPNGDGEIDVRDLLYINVDGGGNCPRTSTF